MQLFDIYISFIKAQFSYKYVIITAEETKKHQSETFWGVTFALNN